MRDPFGFAELSLHVFERGWLSSNNVLFAPAKEGDAAVVDTGYAAHAEQTVALVRHALGGWPLCRIINTHLHSDHCGGNARLQREWPDALTFVPARCFDVAQSWLASALTFEATDQRCERFKVDRPLCDGEVVQLGSRQWEVYPAPGHDPTALMLFEPQSRTLISGDALWEKRLAIVFPELVGEQGFTACLATLDSIERLAPKQVIPGHGRPFRAVSEAIAESRSRVEAFAANPQKHRRHAIRALAMFHLMELRVSSRTALIEWLKATPITADTEKYLGKGWAEDAVTGLVNDQVVLASGELISVR